jgi:hypothetical protein
LLYSHMPRADPRKDADAAQPIRHPSHGFARQEARPAFVVTATRTVNRLTAAHAFLELEAVRLSRADDLASS